MTSLADPDLNIHQYYSITEVRKAVHVQRVADNLEVAPAAVGPRSTPNYAANLRSKRPTRCRTESRCSQDLVTTRSTRPWVDLRPRRSTSAQPGARNTTGRQAPASDGLAGKNVHSIVLQVPKCEGRQRRPGHRRCGPTHTVVRSASCRNGGELDELRRLGQGLSTRYAVGQRSRCAGRSEGPIQCLEPDERRAVCAWRVGPRVGSSDPGVVPRCHGPAAPRTVTTSCRSSSRASPA